MTDHLTLTDREREIVLLAAEGLADKEIAAHLSIAEGTVRTYWERLRPKIGAANRAQAASKLLLALYKDSERARREEAERSHLIIENVRDFAIFTIDLDRCISSWNPGVKHLFGYEEHEWVGQIADMIFTPEDRAQGIPDYELNTSLAKGRAEDERWHIRKDGSRFWGSGIMIGLRDDQGKTVGHAKILRDFTERHSLDQEVGELRARLSQLSGE